MTETQTLGRNEPCPCKSGKKYKRCCGVSAAPKLSVSQKIPLDGGQSGPSAQDRKMMESLDPQMMGQLSQALQRLPKGQIQRLQSLMQKAMHGKDVTAEAAELEASLPPDFQNLMQTWGSSLEAMQGAMGAPSEGTLALDAPLDHSQPASELTVEQARELVAQAAKSGVISEEQAEALIQAPDPATPPTEEAPAAPNRLSKFWRRFKESS